MDEVKQHERSAGIVRGAAAGIVGTMTMSALMALAKKAGALGEPPPRKLVRRTLKRMLPLHVDRRKTGVDVASWAAHFGFGAAMGGLFAAIERGRRPSVPAGVLFGLGVWAVNYMGVVPKLGLMAKPKHDRAGRPTAMVLAHVVYGSTLAAVFRGLRSAA